MADWFRQAREDAGLSQTEMARSITENGYKISQATISYFESGRSLPPMGDPVFRLALAQTLRVPLVRLNALAGIEMTQRGYSLTTIQQAEYFEALPPAYQRIVATLTKGLHGIVHGEQSE